VRMVIPSIAISVLGKLGKRAWNMDEPGSHPPDDSAECPLVPLTMLPCLRSTDLLLALGAIDSTSKPA
jgi:hypothetical protein